MKDLRLFVTDLDGTVLVDRGVDGCHATPRMRAALQGLQRSGVAVCLASGRMHESIRHIAQDLGVAGPIISYNGAMLRGPHDELWVHHTLEAGLAAEVVALAESRDLALNYYLDGVLYARKVQPWWDLYHGRTSSPMQPVESLAGFAGRRPTKLLIHTQPAMVLALRAELAPRLAGRCDLMITSDEYLEFIPPGADKGHVLADLAGRLDLKPDQVVAAGDGWNDLGMLRWAGTSIAIASGRDDLKAVATAVVPGPEQDGLAVWIEQYLLSGSLAGEDARG
jgi:Cof subfamily protein (haloacid dehalogenase superfamily)